MIAREVFDKKLNIIDNLISSFSEKTLIHSHYTSPEAALNIIKHKSFWMTHHRYQNDPSEINYGKTLILEYLLEKFPNEFATLERKLNHFISDDYNILISCFSNHQDYLPGWPYYGQNGKGVAININSELFPNKLTPRLLSLDGVLWKNPQKWAF